MQGNQSLTPPPSLSARGPFQGQASTRVGDALHALCSPATEPWPEGVIARFLTVGGATVDISVSTEAAEPFIQDWGNGVKSPPQECINLTVLVQCQGCKNHDENTYDSLFATVMDRLLESPYGRQAQDWAQAHAEICRALPRPAVTR